MGDKAKKQLKKQIKLLNKSFKSQLKQLEKQGATASLNQLSKKQIKLLAKQMLTPLLASNDAVSGDKRVHQITPAPSEMSFALKPAKKSPCKRCPALAGGLCKCALKLQQKQDTLKIKVL
jgi:hypothetical protein